MTDQIQGDLADELAQSGVPVMPNDYATLHQLIQSLPSPLLPDIKAATTGQVQTTDPAATAVAQMTSGLAGQPIGTESGSVLGVSGPLFYGNANLLVNPLVDAASPVSLVAALTDYQFAWRWHTYFAITTGTITGLISTAYNRDATNDNPLNTSMVNLAMIATAGGDGDFIVYHEGWNPAGLNPSLPYITAAAKIMTDGIDVNTTKFQVRMEIASFDGSIVRAAGPWFDLLGADLNQPYLISAAYPKPAGGWWSENFRLQIHAQWANSASGNDSLYFGEPSLALSANQSPPPFAPIIAKWTPGELNAYNASGKLLLRVGEQYSGTSGGNEIEWTDPSTGFTEFRLRRNAAGDLAMYAQTGITAILRAMSPNAMAAFIAQVTADTQPRATLRGDGTEVGLRFGAGGASTQDLRIRRSGTKILEIDDAAGGATAILKALGILRLGGTSFPTSKATGDVFFRTDFGEWFYWSGAHWLSVTEHDMPLDINTTGSISATTNNASWRGVELHGGTDLWITRASCGFDVAGGGSSLGVSHNWVGTVEAGRDGVSTWDAIATFTINSGASGVPRRMDSGLTPGLLDNGTVHALLRINWVKTGTPGALFAGARVFYRVVAT